MLRDFAPAFLLLPVPHRRRAQCLLAYAHTLFDFVRQQGIEGERMTEINRWEFALELALEGEPIGQPIFLRIAAEEKHRPWHGETFSVLGRMARQAIMEESSQDPTRTDEQLQTIVRAILLSLLDEEPRPEWLEIGAVMIRVRSLQHLGDELRFGRHRLLPHELEGSTCSQVGPELVASSVRRECRSLKRRLQTTQDSLARLPAAYRRAGRFLCLSALALLGRIERDGGRLLEHAPGLGILARITLLLRALR